MFYEKRIKSVPFFQFSELGKVKSLLHVFTSKLTDIACGLDQNSDQDTKKNPVLKVLGVSETKTIQIQQIHSHRVCHIGWVTDERPEGDAMVLTSSGVFGIIKTADCLPVLVIDPFRQKIAMVHAGWRGTLGRILKNSILEMGILGSDPTDLIVVLGPSIRNCCYKVGLDCRVQFQDQGHDVDRIFLGGNLDLIEANLAQAEAAGVGQVLDSGMCTCCNPDLFYSHRRDGDKRRMWVLAGFTG